MDYKIRLALAMLVIILRLVVIIILKVIIKKNLVFVLVKNTNIDGLFFCVK
jgi:hypothetical protein